MTPETLTQEQKKIRDSLQEKSLCASQRNTSDGNNGYFRFQTCIMPTTSLRVVHVWMRTQERLEGKRKGETCHQKRIRNGRRRQHILGRFDVHHSWDHPANVRFLNIRMFLGGNSFCRPCHLIHVYLLATRPNPHQIHRGQSSLRAYGRNLRHQSEEMSH